MMISLQQYWMGRDDEFPLAMTPKIEEEATRTVALANAVLERYQAAGHNVPVSPKTKTQLTSGWRPPTVNSATPNAAPNSKHMTGQAIDLYDPDGDFDEWLTDNIQVLVTLGLWREHPAATKGWVHLQTIPPRSGNRSFYP